MAPTDFARDAEWFAAGAQYRHSGAMLGQSVDDRGAADGKVLAVVEHDQQRRFGPQDNGQLIERGRERLLYAPYRSEHCGGDCVGFGDGREIYPPGATVERSAASAATCRARRVLPTPPEPVNVMHR